jgi:hypothetical protein
VHWRGIRDQALLELADRLAGGLPTLRQAAIVRAALVRYAASRWLQVDRFRHAAPERDALLFRVLHAGAGRVPSIGHLRRLLISGQAMSSPAAHKRGRHHREHRWPCRD